MNNNGDLLADYVARDWSIIPICVGTKKPACRSWKPFQTKRPTEADHQRWFGNGKPASMAVICGAVSGGLVIRDFDDMAAYERWADANPVLAETLPTVATGRPGRHVYCRADIDPIRKASKSGDGAIIELGDGELRGGGYCLLPPSSFERPAMGNYRWIVPLGDDLPRVDLFEAGFLPCNREDRENREHTGTCLQSSLSSQCSVSSQFSLLHEQVEAAIQRTLPSHEGKRHRAVFEFVRELKAVAALADAPLSELKPYVKQWHKRALPNIGTKPFEESWFDFGESWSKVKFAKGQEPVAMIFAKSQNSELPEVAKQYEQESVRDLVALCRELQRACGTEPFFLDCRTAGRLLGVNHTTAARWLRGFQRDGILELVKAGSLRDHKASRYRYLKEL